MNLPNYKHCKILVIGLGYVGLPLTVEFSKRKHCLLSKSNLKRTITGFDINELRISELNLGIDNTNEVDNEELKGLITGGSLKLTSSLKGNENYDFFIVTVPTPINKDKKPDLTPLKNASSMIGELLKSRSSKIKPFIIFESTVFPGATEEICAPIISKSSELVYKEDFYCGYSPERINPGDKNHRLTNIKKVVSGCNDKVSKVINDLYGSIINAGTFIAPSIKVAEAAKIIENTQRDLNIALVNELSMLFRKMDIDTLDVLEAAETKWNFLPFKPGLVGGHCIGVDPYYLTFKAEEIGFKPKLIQAGRETNDNMSNWIIEIFTQECTKRNHSKKDIKVLILGVTFKENCPDFRNTMVIRIIEELDAQGIKLIIVDPYINRDAFTKIYKFNLLNKLTYSERFDSVICAVPHEEFKKLGELEWLSMIKDNGFFIDIKGIIPRKLNPIRI